MNACSNCGKMILEGGITYSINPSVVCDCKNPNPITTEDNELQEMTRNSIALLVAQRRGSDVSDDGDGTTASNILFVCSKLIASEVAKAEIAIIDRLTEPHHDTMHDTYDYDGIAESVLNERNTLKGKK